MADRKKDDAAETGATPAHQGAGRPNDTPIVDAIYPNSTLASRAAARAKREAPTNKRVAAESTESK